MPLEEPPEDVKFFRDAPLWQGPLMKMSLHLPSHVMRYIDDRRGNLRRSQYVAHLIFRLLSEQHGGRQPKQP